MEGINRRLDFTLPWQHGAELGAQIIISFFNSSNKAGQIFECRVQLLLICTALSRLGWRASQQLHSGCLLTHLKFSFLPQKCHIISLMKCCSIHCFQTRMSSRHWLYYFTSAFVESRDFVFIQQYLTSILVLSGKPVLLKLNNRRQSLNVVFPIGFW